MSPNKQNYVCMCVRPGRFPTRRIPTREAPHNQNYDQGAYPQAESRPGSWLAGWLAGGITTREPVMHWLAGWLAGGLAGWLSEAQRAPRRPREAHRSGAWIEQACDALGWRLPRSRLTTREAPHRFRFGTQEEAPADYHYVCMYVCM